MSNYILYNGELYNADELKHYGVKGMKWGVRKKRDGSNILQRIRQKTKERIADQERRALVKDARNVTYKAPSGKHAAVYGKYRQKRGGYVYNAMHIVNDQGKVKLSYIRGMDGDRYIAAGRDYISKLDLKQFFRNTHDMHIEYDVYD